MKEKKYCYEIYRQKKLIDILEFDKKMEIEDIKKYAEDTIGYPPDISIKEKKESKETK